MSGARLRPMTLEAQFAAELRLARTNPDYRAWLLQSYDAARAFVLGEGDGAKATRAHRALAQSDGADALRAAPTGAVMLARDREAERRASDRRAVERAAAPVRTMADIIYPAGHRPGD